MSENSKKQQAGTDLDNWLASNKGQVTLFVLLIAMAVFGIVREII